MKNTTPYFVIGLGVIVMAFIAWWFGFRDRAEEAVTPEETAEVDLKEGLSIYTSGEQGFLIAYPEGAKVLESFENRNLPNVWRMNALSEGTGTPLLSITTYSTESDSSYPRYYDAVVRLGMSTDPKEVAECEKPRTEQGETVLPDRTIGDISWKAFSFGDAAMMKYVKGVSYRTVHNGACYALEQIASGSSYKDDAPSDNDIPDTTLEAEYEKLGTIIDSFRFAR